MGEIINWFVIVNPSAGNGMVRRKWPKIQNLFKQYGMQYEVAQTAYHKHGLVLAVDAIKNGFRHLIIVGGDGTIHNVINGIMQQQVVAKSSVSIGIIPVGTGNDWVKTFGMPKQIDSAVRSLLNPKTVLHDVGVIRSVNNCFTETYFNNLTGIGFDGYVVNKVKSYKKFGVLAYLFGALSGIFKAKNFSCTITTENQSSSLNVLMVLIGIGKYSGGGMQLTRYSNFDNGLFDISMAKSFSPMDIIRNLPNLFNGKISNHKKVSIDQSSFIKIALTDNEQPYIQSDGELLGTGGFEIRIIPRAIRVIVP